MSESSCKLFFSVGKVQYYSGLHFSNKEEIRKQKVTFRTVIMCSHNVEIMEVSHLKGRYERKDVRYFCLHYFC